MRYIFRGASIVSEKHSDRLKRSTRAILLYCAGAFLGLFSIAAAKSDQSIWAALILLGLSIACAGNAGRIDAPTIHVRELRVVEDDDT